MERTPNPKYRGISGRLVLSFATLRVSLNVVVSCCNDRQEIRLLTGTEASLEGVVGRIGFATATSAAG